MPEDDRIMAERPLSADLLEPLIGRAFHVETGAGSIDLTLTSVTRLPPPRKASDAGEPVPLHDVPARMDPFTILLEGQAYLPQRIYRFSGQSFGPFDIFIVPVAQQKSGGFVYQAVFG
jgi:Domain of unknown function (DUF6916)